MSEKIKPFFYVLWVMHPMLQLGIAAFMLRRGLLRQFKFFFAYVLTQLITFAVLFPAYVWRSYNAAFYLYWCLNAASVACGFLVIHEIFGMSDWVQDLTDELAEAGYIAIAPDLLSGMGPNGGRTNSFAGQSEVTEAVSHLNPDQVTADLNAVADYALKLPSTNKMLFVTGYCWGGGQSFRFATNRKDLKAAFVFYGVPPAKDVMKNITAPVYGFYAGNDNRIDSTIPQTKEDMAAAGKTYEPVTYEGAGHGFMRAGEAPDASEANKKARDEAWDRWKKLLARAEGPSDLRVMP